MINKYRRRRIILIVAVLILLTVTLLNNIPKDFQANKTTVQTKNETSSLAVDALGRLQIKGRAPKTDYGRDKFGDGWKRQNGCDTRNIILNRDLINVVIDSDCNVMSGILDDPYTGKEIHFIRGTNTSGDVQIDHVVALSDAWQKGAQVLTYEKRVELANDPLELLAVDGGANNQKSDGDAATWLPPNKAFRCQYVARQIAVKQKYQLWVTRAEHDVMLDVLSKCQSQLLPTP